MDNLLFSLDATVPIFLTMIAGVVLRHVGLMDETFTGYLNRFVFRVALPALLFLDLARQDFASAWDGRYVGFCVFATFVSIAVVALVAHFAIHDRPRRGEFVQASYRSSAAILGLAFIENIYGAGNEGMAPLMILGSVPLYNVVAVVLLTLTAPTVGEAESRRGAGELMVKACRGIVTNPIILGIAAGFVWSLLGLPLPSIAETTLDNVGSLATPLGLMAMGASFDVRKVRGDVAMALVASAIKLVGFVAVFMPLAVWMGFRDQQLVALLVMLGSSTTVSSYIMATNMGHDGTLTSAAVMMTTAGCAFTLTMWLTILKSLALIAG